MSRRSDEPSSGTRRFGAHEGYTRYLPSADRETGDLEPKSRTPLAAARPSGSAAAESPASCA
jgi:hypothetical protein